MINKLYKYFLASFFFWAHLLKGAVVYSLIPAGYALFSVIEDVRKGKDEDSVGHLYKTYFMHKKKLKWESFVFAIFLISIYSLLFLVNQISGSASVLLSFILIYVLIMTIIILTFTLNFLRYRTISLKQSVIFSFVYCIKNLWITILILLVLGIVVNTANKNLIFLLFIAPAVYGLFVRILFEKFFESKLPASITADE